MFIKTFFTISIISLTCFWGTVAFSQEAQELPENAILYPETPPDDSTKTVSQENTVAEKDYVEQAAKSSAPNYLFSAWGPGVGKGVIGVGTRAFFVLPSFDINYVRGISKSLDFELRASSIGFFNMVEPGIRYRLVEKDSIALALRAGLTAIPVITPPASGNPALLAVGLQSNLGILVSMGRGPVKLTFGVNALANVLDGGVVSDGNEFLRIQEFAPRLGIYPSVAVEFPVGKQKKKNLYIQAQTLAQFGGGFFLPMLSVGFSW